MLNDIEFNEEIRLIGLSMSSFNNNKTEQITFKI